MTVNHNRSHQIPCRYACRLRVKTALCIVQVFRVRLSFCDMMNPTLPYRTSEPDRCQRALAEHGLDKSSVRLIDRRGE